MCQQQGLYLGRDARRRQQRDRTLSAPTHGSEGGAAVVFASGFLAPPMMGDPPLASSQLPPDGTVVEFPAVQNSARLQVIHNSASLTVDIWVNDNPFDKLSEYRTATPYIDVPAGTNLNIGVAPSCCSHR
ncbi:MAG: hypothetical protein R2788_20240 [Saprospiraceae bacterium]